MLVQHTARSRFVAIALLSVWAVPAGVSGQQENEPTADAAMPVGDEHVQAIQLLTIPQAVSGSAEAVAADDDFIYLAGQRWNREDKTRLWLWCVDRSGRKLWERSLGAQQSNEEMTIVGLLPGARLFGHGGSSHGVRVLHRHGQETKLSFFRADGESVFEKNVGLLENSHGLVEDDQDHTYLFGTSTATRNQPTHAWVARISRLGTVQWKRTFHPNVLTTEDRPLDAKGGPSTRVLVMSLLMDAALLRDGSIGLVGQTGMYDKFGQGPSELWLLRIDRDGNTLAQTFVDDGRLFPSGRDLIARCGDGCIVPYTTVQLGQISMPTSGDGVAGHGTRLACFDIDLHKIWDQPWVPSTMPGAVTVTGPEPFVTMTATMNRLLIQGVSSAGTASWRVCASTSNCFITPLAVVRNSSGLIAVCNYRSHDRSRDDAQQKVLLVYATPGS